MLFKKDALTKVQLNEGHHTVTLQNISTTMMLFSGVTAVAILYS